MVQQKVHRADVYKLFLQGALSRRVMSDEVAKALWRACVGAIGDADEEKRATLQEMDVMTDWQRFVQLITEQLEPTELAFSTGRNEEDGKVIWAIVNQTSDDVAQVASDYTPTEIAFFKAVVEQIMLAQRYAYSITFMNASREASYLKNSAKMTKVQAQLALDSFVARGWLAKSARARYSLGTRALLELGSYLEDTYEDQLLKCTACHEPVTKGIRCATPNCHAYLHRYCYNAMRRRNQCPSCQEQWVDGQKGQLHIGEDAVPDGAKETRQVRRAGTDEEEEAEEEEMDELETQSQSQSQTQRTQSLDGTQARSKKSKGKQPAANGKRKKKAAASESEEEDLPDDLFADDTVDIDDPSQIRASTPSQTQSSRRSSRR